jgi:hypothetical protein
LKPHLDSTERPDRVHGRLLESVHLSGYSAARACEELGWLLRQDRWKQVSPGYDDINAFMATLDLKEFRFAVEQRKTLVQQLKALDAGQRATARLLGVSQETVGRDLGLRTDTNVSPALANSRTESALTGETMECLEKSIDVGDTNVSPVRAPYYADSGITLYHADCREVLPSLERGLMVTDPPYNIGYHYDQYHDAMEEQDYWTFLCRVLLMPLVLIHYPECLFPVARHFCRAPDEVVAWIYGANTPKQWRAIGWFGVTPDLSLDSQEFRNPNDKRVRQLMAEGRMARLYDWWPIEQVKNVSHEKTEHPCQIPTALMLRALRVTPFEGPIIDPFCGSGTTLLAAQELGRRAIGIESSEEYCEIAVQRLQQRTLDLVMDA